MRVLSFAITFIISWFISYSISEQVFKDSFVGPFFLSMVVAIGAFEVRKVLCD